jgi:hypothetical protein
MKIMVISEKTPLINIIMGYSNSVIDGYRDELNWFSKIKLEDLTDSNLDSIKWLRDMIGEQLHFQRAFLKGSEEEDIVRITNQLCKDLLDYEFGLLESNKFQARSINEDDSVTDSGIIHETTI